MKLGAFMTSFHVTKRSLVGVVIQAVLMHVSIDGGGGGAQASRGGSLGGSLVFNAC